MFAESYQIVQEHYDMSGHVYRIISVQGIELSSIFFLQFAQMLEYALLAVQGIALSSGISSPIR